MNSIKSVSSRNNHYWTQYLNIYFRHLYRHSPPTSNHPYSFSKLKFSVNHCDIFILFWWPIAMWSIEPCWLKIPSEFTISFNARPISLSLKQIFDHPYQSSYPGEPILAFWKKNLRRHIFGKTIFGQRSVLREATKANRKKNKMRIWMIFFY